MTGRDTRSRLSSALSARRGRVRTVCTACRQAKVRCNVDQVPCSRCQRLQLKCNLGRSSAQRSVVSRGSHSVQRAHSSRQALENHNDAPSRSLDAVDGIYEGQGPQTSRRVAHEESRENGLDPSALEAGSSSASNAPAPFLLGDVSLTKELALQLFTSFFTKYHPHVPFLDPDRTLLSYYEASEFLFWAIISVAARDEPNALHFLDAVTPFFSTIIGRLLVGCGKGDTIRLGDVQALALLALWPWQNVHWWTDRSWNLGSLAFSSAVQIGLHQPFYEAEYSLACGPVTDALRSERVRTFCACIAIAQNLTVDVGLSMTLPFGTWLVNIARRGTAPFDIPLDLKHYLMIQDVSYANFSSLPTSMGRDDFGLYSSSLAIILPQCESRFNEMAQTQMSLYNRMNLAAAQFYLQCVYFQVNDADPQRNAGILRAYTTALRLIDMAMSGAESSNILRYSPRTTVRMLVMAAAAIFRVLHSSLRCEVIYETGRSLFNAAALCVGQQAVKSRAQDTPVRWATFLHKMWEIGTKDEVLLLVPPTLQIKSRGGASIFYDCLQMFRHKLRTRNNGDVTELDDAGQDQEIATGLAADSDLFDFLWMDEFDENYLYSIT